MAEGFSCIKSIGKPLARRLTRIFVEAPRKSPLTANSHDTPLIPEQVYSQVRTVKMTTLRSRT